jgi:LPPG:FO 2-phospho-L-lactate transferase
VRIVAIAGGVGGAKMADGLARAVPDLALSVVVNTADDFDLFGLRISPDLDTVMYTLGGIANPVTGWGVDGDTRNTLDAIERYVGESWFLIGDQDLATHVLRTVWLGRGFPLSEVTHRLAAALSIRTAILPMTDDRVATIVETPGGPLEFQEYFVRRRQQDEVTGVRFEGADRAVALPDAIEAIERAEIVILCPSNPIVSIGPILAVPGFREALVETRAPRIAVSPIIGGKALKGPADRMLASLGLEASALGVARLYDGLIDGFVIDVVDEHLVPAIQAENVDVLVTESVMKSVGDRERLGREIIDFSRSVARHTGVPA